MDQLPNHNHNPSSTVSSSSSSSYHGPSHQQYAVANGGGNPAHDTSANNVSLYGTSTTITTTSSSTNNNNNIASNNSSSSSLPVRGPPQPQQPHHHVLHHQHHGGSHSSSNNNNNNVGVVAGNAQIGQRGGMSLGGLGGTPSSGSQQQQQHLQQQQLQPQNLRAGSSVAVPSSSDWAVPNPLMMSGEGGGPVRLQQQQQSHYHHQQQQQARSSSNNQGLPPPPAVMMNPTTVQQQQHQQNRPLVQSFQQQLHQKYQQHQQQEKQLQEPSGNYPSFQPEQLQPQPQQLLPQQRQQQQQMYHHPQPSSSLVENNSHVSSLQQQEQLRRQSLQEQQEKQQQLLRRSGLPQGVQGNAQKVQEMFQQQPIPLHNQQQQSQQQHQQQHSQPMSSKPKVILSHEAKKALGKAILSAIRSPTGEIDPDLMHAAVMTGLPRQAIVNAARVARDRESAKRKEMQGRAQPPQQQSQQLQQDHQRQQQHLALLRQQQNDLHQRQKQLQLQQREQEQQQQRHHNILAPPTHPMSQKHERGQQQHQQQQHPHYQGHQMVVTAPRQHPGPIPMPPEHYHQQQPYPQSRQTPQPSLHHHNSSSHRPVEYPPPTTRQPHQQGGVVPLHHHQAQSSFQVPPPQPKKEQVNQQPRPPSTSTQQKKQNALGSSGKAPKVSKQSSLTSGGGNAATKGENTPTKTKNSTGTGSTKSGGTDRSGKLTAKAERANTISKAKQLALQQQALATKALQLKMEERSKWKRAHQGVFVVQKTKFVAGPHSMSAVVRTKCQDPVLDMMDDNVLLAGSVRPASKKRKAISGDILEEAFHIQQLLQSQSASVASSTTPLLDPEKFKRIKIEPKKFAKALDRIVRKSRQTAAEALNKQHKELSKAISSHQQEFFKFHKQKRADASKIARSIRDIFAKDTKKKEKDTTAAEKARLTALKANDMDAYSKLLEETKNERLQFLMDKTERHFSQISSSLLEERNKDGSVAAMTGGGTASYYASAHLKTEEVRQPSILVGGDLKEYQISGLQWMISLYNNKLNGILADEMGLGKTIQAISLIAYLMEFKNNLGPYLVIVPLSTLSNWNNEFHKWCPSAHLICYKGTPAQRKDIYREQVKNGHFNVLLTTYEYIIKDKASLRKAVWQYAIVDEGHRMKNAGSKFARTLSTQYETKFRILLTGTPLMNDLSELWSLLNFLLPTIFNSVETFDQWFNKPFASFGNAASNNEDEANFLSNEERMFIIHRLHELLRPFMLRRVKSEVLDQLPEKVEKILRCELSSWQKELYKQISRKAVAETNLLGNNPADAQPITRGLNNAVMQLRKVCNHPYLFSPEGYHINENIIRSSAKVELLDRMLPKLRAAGHRVLMFTQMTAVMTILEDYFSYRGYLSLRLDGSTPADEREKRMYKFNAPDSPYFIFLLSTRAGGLGLNLTAANTVIIFDSDWNPMMDLQAQDRAHRIGQRSDVSVFRMVSHSPVEEKILSRATEKLNMSELVVEAGKFDKSSVENDNSLERKRLMEVLLTDFESTAKENAANKAAEQKIVSDFNGSDEGDDDNEDNDDDDDDNNSEGSKEENLNELLSNNEYDYQLYKSMDKVKTSLVDHSLFTSEGDIPDWIKYPTGKKDAALQETSVPESGARKRKDVIYDDGLTEKQFLRMMDKKFEQEEALAKEGKLAKREVGAAVGQELDGLNSKRVPINSELTDWTFRKLISCAKIVVTLKDPSTKRRVCEIFMDKPSPEQFPDYYEIIEKPISINDILRKCRGKLYANISEFREDWKLMFANAKVFNGEDSWVVEDGKAIEKELDRVLKKNGFSDEGVKPKTPPKPAKKLRIKLSLKTLKSNAEQLVPAEEKSDDGADAGDAMTDGPVKKKRKKLKQTED